MNRNPIRPNAESSSGFRSGEMKEIPCRVRPFMDSDCLSEPGMPRFRVNDPDIVMHPTFGRRSECTANGLMPASCPIHPADMETAELKLAVWGGHPGTAAKKLHLNGKGLYDLPPDGTERGHCAYTFPVIRLEPRHLVSGMNALQFSCEKGSSFWGHFIIDEAVLRVFPKRDLTAGTPGIPRDLWKAVNDDSILPHMMYRIDEGSELVSIGLDSGGIPETDISGVDFFAGYFDYDVNGSGSGSGTAGCGDASCCGSDDYQGFPIPGGYQGHAGTAGSAPYTAHLDLRMVPDQAGPLRLKAEVRLKDGSGLVVEGLAGIPFPPRRQASVILLAATDLPCPFWSRAGKHLEARIATDDPTFRRSSVQGGLCTGAELLMKVWDGGRGMIAHPIDLNGVPVDASGSGRHDFIVSRIPIDPGILFPGEQKISLLSDTEHHGIEVALPGPALVLRFEA